jgi:hypothetical protein
MNFSSHRRAPARRKKLRPWNFGRLLADQGGQQYVSQEGIIGNTNDLRTKGQYRLDYRPMQTFARREVQGGVRSAL